MVIFLYGPDTYRREAKRRFYIGEFEKKYSSHGIERVDLAASAALETLSASARSRSLFESAKLVLAENPMEITPKKLREALTSFMDDKQLNIILTADKKPLKAFEFLLKAPVTSAAFEHLEGAAWQKFVRETMVALKVKLEPDAMELLARTYAKDSWGLVTELQKLSGSEKLLSAAALGSLGLETLPDFFPLVQALRSPRVADRCAALVHLEHSNEPAAKIFNILSALWTEKTPQFAAYDRAVKMGRMDYEEALADLAIN